MVLVLGQWAASLLTRYTDEQCAPHDESACLLGAAASTHGGGQSVDGNLSCAALLIHTRSYSLCPKLRKHLWCTVYLVSVWLVGEGSAGTRQGAFFGDT